MPYLSPVTCLCALTDCSTHTYIYITSYSIASWMLLCVRRCSRLRTYVRRTSHRGRSLRRPASSAKAMPLLLSITSGEDRMREAQFADPASRIHCRKYLRWTIIPSIAHTLYPLHSQFCIHTYRISTRFQGPNCTHGHIYAFVMTTLEIFSFLAVRPGLSSGSLSAGAKTCHFQCRGHLVVSCSF